MREGELPEGISSELTQEKRIIRKPAQFLHEVGITDFRYEEREDGVHFFIPAPPEHVAQRARMRASMLNAPNPTDFEWGPLLDFERKINETMDLVWVYVPNDNDAVVEIVISKVKGKKLIMRKQSN